MHERIKWRRENHAHQHSRRIVNRFQVIAVEESALGSLPTPPTLGGQEGTAGLLSAQPPVVVSDDALVVTIGHGAIVHACTVEDGCLIGMGSTILDGARIGRGSLVGAGALVTPGTVIPPGSLVLGAPARVKRPINAAEREQIATGAAHYVELARRYLAGAPQSSLR